MTYDPDKPRAERADEKLPPAASERSEAAGGTVAIAVSLESKDGVDYVLVQKRSSGRNKACRFRWTVQGNDGIEILTVEPRGAQPLAITKRRRGPNGRWYEATFTLIGREGSREDPIEVLYDLWYADRNGDVCLAYGGTPVGTPEACPQDDEDREEAARGPNPPPETDFP